MPRTKDPSKQKEKLSATQKFEKLNAESESLNTEKAAVEASIQEMTAQRAELAQKIKEANQRIRKIGARLKRIDVELEKVSEGRKKEELHALLESALDSGKSVEDIAALLKA